MKSFNYFLVALGIFCDGKCCAWELAFEPSEIVGYTYSGAVFAGYYFFTNWVPLAPNTATNFKAFSGGATATNGFLVALASNAITATEQFSLTAGGRGGDLPRGGIRADRIAFRVIATGSELPGMMLPWEARLRATISAQSSTYHIYGSVTVCEANEPLAGCSSAPMTYTLTNDYRVIAGDPVGPVLLRVGSRHEMTFSLAAGAGEHGGEAAALIGAAVISLTESLLLDLDIVGNGPRLTLRGHPGRRYVLERSKDFVAWQPLVTNTPPTGTFTFADVEAPASTTVFYRGVRTE